MILPTLAMSAIMFLGLQGIYGALQSHWPASYVNITTSSGQLGRFSLSWYLFFRLAPTFLVAVVIAVSAERLMMSPSCVVITGLAVYALFALHKTVFGPRGMSSRGKSVLVGCTGITLTVVAGVLALYLRSYFAPIIPTPSALLEAIWTALIVTVMYFAFSRLLDNKFDHQSLQERAKKEIGDQIWEYSALEARKHGLQASTVQAILLTEAIQRPRWFRLIEEVFQSIQGLFNITGTTGIAQMPSRWPLSDKKSVTLLCNDIQDWVRSNREVTDTESLIAYGRYHNDDDVYVNSLAEQFELLTHR